VLADEVNDAIHPWLTAMRLRRPYVTAKWGSSLDGRTAASDGTSQWITGPEARADVHRRRALADAIVVGTGTVLADDPTLTARTPDGDLYPHQPRPVVIGSRSIPVESKLAAHPAGMLQLDGDLRTVLDTLWDQEVRHVFIEGGPTLTSAFIAAGLVDEYLVYLAPVLIGGDRTAVTDIGVDTIADARRLAVVSTTAFGDDILIVARPTEEN
jgi:diaminohydroxyphosphoribosylaminopyrimidine deaminase/5-amino-6-(5-phosphoribosylamino)uracil reductase